MGLETLILQYFMGDVLQPQLTKEERKTRSPNSSETEKRNVNLFVRDKFAENLFAGFADRRLKRIIIAVLVHVFQRTGTADGRLNGCLDLRADVARAMLAPRFNVYVIVTRNDG